MMHPSELHAAISSIGDENDAIMVSRSKSDGPRTAVGNAYVLVVEDEGDVRDVVAEVLEEAGYEVLTASDGVEGFRILDAEYLQAQLQGEPPRQPSVILLDLMMPAMDGLNFYVHLRRFRPQFANVPVIIMSADQNVQRFDWVVAKHYGLTNDTDTLPKPFGIEDLLKKVRKAVGV